MIFNKNLELSSSKNTIIAFTVLFLLYYNFTFYFLRVFVMDIINVIDWDAIAKKAIDLDERIGIINPYTKRLMDRKVVSGQYSTVHLNVYQIIGNNNFSHVDNLPMKTGEFWEELEDLLVVDIERGVLNDIRNEVLSEFAIEISNVNKDIWYGLSPDVIAKIYDAYISLFYKNINDRLYNTSNDELVLLSKPLSKIVDVDDGEWEDEDIKEFIVYRKEK